MTARDEVVLDGELILEIPLDGEISLDNVLDGEVGIVTVINHYDTEVYDGDTTITPTQQTQTLSTRNKTVLTDIIISPIPSNYGLITRIGSGIRIS